MSESVNSKVVIFWIIFIFVFAGLGLFGYFNQDLVEKKTEDEPFIPVVNNNNNKIKSCTASVERGDLTYDFILNENEEIKDLRIIYTAKDGTIDDYAAATNLSNINVLGINPSLQNEYNNFTLMLLLTINSYDETALSNYRSDLDLLNIVLFNDSSLEKYTKTIEYKYGSIQCVDKENN